MGSPGAPSRAPAPLRRDAQTTACKALSFDRRSTPCLRVWLDTSVTVVWSAGWQRGHAAGSAPVIAKRAEFMWVSGDGGDQGVPGTSLRSGVSAVGSRCPTQMSGARIRGRSSPNVPAARDVVVGSRSGAFDAARGDGRGSSRTRLDGIAISLHANWPSATSTGVRRMANLLPATSSACASVATRTGSRPVGPAVRRSVSHRAARVHP